MDTPMHFRKRQLLEYQSKEHSIHPNNIQQPDIHGFSYSYVYEPQITFEYPLSPSSIGSEKSTPTKCENNSTDLNSFNTNEYSTEQMQILAKNTVTLLEMENLSPKSSKDAQKLTQIAESLTALENYSHYSNPQYVEKITYDNSTLIHFAYNLKQSIEEYIQQEISNASSNKSSSLSTLILAKLNQLRVNALLQPKICEQEVPYDLSYTPDQNLEMVNACEQVVPYDLSCTPDQDLEMVPEDLSFKPGKNNYHSILQDPTIDLDYEEPTLVIDESYEEMQVDDDENHGIVQEYQSIEGNTRQGLFQIATRISGIFSFINRTQTRMEILVKKGVTVYEKGPRSSKKSKKKTSSSKKSSTSHSSSSTQLIKSKPSNTQLVKSEASDINNFTSMNIFNQFSTTTTTKMEDVMVFAKPTKPAPRCYPKPWTNGLGDEVKYNNDYPIPCPYDDALLIIGKNGTRIFKSQWEQVNWKSTPPAITRKILVFLFDREVLGTHSLTGRPSPAFVDLNYPEKKALDARIVTDLVNLVTSRTIATAKEVRMAITTKCADESKMRRTRQARLTKQLENLRMRPY